MSDVVVSGVEDILKKMKILPGRVQKNVVTGAVRASAKPIIEEARRLAPKDTGDLAKSIAVTRRKSTDRNIVRFTVAPRIKKPHGYLAHFYEFGTSKMTARPFMRPALLSKVDETISAATGYMAKRTEKEIKKL